MAKNDIPQKNWRESGTRWASSTTGRRIENLPLRPDSNRSWDKPTTRVDVPRGDPESLDVKVVGGFLTIKGSREENQSPSMRKYYLRETRYGAFEQTLQSREGVKADDLKATH